MHVRLCCDRVSGKKCNVLEFSAFTVLHLRQHKVEIQPGEHIASRESDHSRLPAKYTDASIPCKPRTPSRNRINVSLQQSAPPRGPNFIRPTSSRTSCLASVDVSVTSETWLITLSPLLQHGRCSGIVRVVYAQCSMSVSTKVLCALVTKTLVVRCRDFWSRRSGVRDTWMVKTVGTKV